MKEIIVKINYRDFIVKWWNNDDMKFWTWVKRQLCDAGMPLDCSLDIKAGELIPVIGTLNIASDYTNNEVYFTWTP